jgi:hypothetical protein
MPDNMFLIPFSLTYLTKTLYTRPFVLTYHYKMVLLSVRTCTCLMLPELSYFICMYPNVFGVIPSLLHATSSTRCLPLSLTVSLLAPSYFLPLQSSLCLLEFLGVFVLFTTLDPVWTNLILVPLSVSFLVIHLLRRDISATLTSVDATFVESQSYFSRASSPKDYWFKLSSSSSIPFPTPSSIPSSFIFVSSMKAPAQVAFASKGSSSVTIVFQTSTSNSSTSSPLSYPPSL